MKKLGLGIQALSEFRVNDYIYVDKTRHIHKMIDDGKYYFCPVPAALASRCWLIPSTSFSPVKKPSLKAAGLLIIGIGTRNTRC